MGAGCEGEEAKRVGAARPGLRGVRTFPFLFLLILFVFSFSIYFLYIWIQSQTQLTNKMSAQQNYSSSKIYVLQHDASTMSPLGHVSFNHMEWR